jgi:uncharacterized membrane protein
VTDRTLRAAVVALALVGAGIAGYVLAARLAGSDLYCSTGGCEKVQISPYAELLGVPLAALGLGAYLTVAASALAGAAGRLVGAALALAGVAFSAYLLIVQLTVIDAVCLWCIANDIVATLLAVTTLLRLRDLRGARVLGLAVRIE